MLSCIIRYFRVKKTFDKKGKPKMKKVEFSFGDARVGGQEGVRLEALLSDTLTRFGGIRKNGAAPAGELERLIQRALSKAAGKMEE